MAQVRQRIAKLHGTIGDRRTNGHHQLANQLVSDHDLIVIEDLNVSGLLRKPKPVLDEMSGRYMPNGRSSKRALARAISDAGWGNLRRLIEEKADRAGKRVIAVNPAYTSQTCNVCGHVDQANRPSQATFKCVACGHSDHADINAAKNILAAGLAERQNGRGVARKSKPRLVADVEASTLLKTHEVLTA